MSAAAAASAFLLSGEVASMRILLSGLGLTGEYACDMLRTKGFASGNGFDACGESCGS
jgi:hypothetical protein